METGHPGNRAKTREPFLWWSALGDVSGRGPQQDGPRGSAEDLDQRFNINPNERKNDFVVLE